MTEHALLYSIFLIFTGAAILATASLFARQTLIVAYIALGALVGPPGLGLVEQADMIADIAHIGIMFLLYLLGLNLHPQKLIEMLREATTVTLASSALFALAGLAVSLLWGFSMIEAVLVGIACMFSSTILALKLLPTTALHHRHAGEIIISVLLIQDLIAIVVLVILHGLVAAGERALWLDVTWLLLALPALIATAFLAQRYLIVPLLRRFDRIPEYIFLLAIGWCLGMAQLSAWLNLSHEIGAFIAGVALAAGPIARFIAENLKPLRDFFLVVFFFFLGATFDPDMAMQVLVPALILTALIIVIKPPVFRMLLGRAGEKRSLSWEIGVRMGQGSEFSLLIAVLALQTGVIGQQASSLIQTTTLLCFVISSYLIVFSYPTPIAVSDRLRQD